MKRPNIHFNPKKNWMNDPNGLCYFNNKYHMYFQYFPYGLEWGTMHWGHASSTDLLNWEEHDLALYPTIEADRNGCFSGSAIVVDNELIITYTGVKYNNTPDDDIHNFGELGFISKQIIAKSEDGFTFDNKRVIIDEVNDPTFADKMHIRDPKIWKHDDAYYICLGTKVKNHMDFDGKLLIYKSYDLKEFNVIDTYKSDFVGNMWECPDLFEVDNQFLLIMSPEQMTLDGVNYENNSIICKANFDYKTEKVSIDSDFEYFDYGLDSYAVQTFLDKDNQRVAIAWLRMGSPINGYRGLMTLPRVINYNDGNITYSIHPNTYKLMRKVDSVDLRYDATYIKTTISDYQTLNIGGVLITHTGNELKVDRNKVYAKYDKIGNVFNSKPIVGLVNLEIIIDINVIEIFIGECDCCITLCIENIKDIITIENNYELKTIGGPNE